MGVPSLTGIADAAADVVTAKAITLDGNACKVYATEPRALDTLPAVAIRFSGFDRRNLDEADHQLGTEAWDLTYVVTVEVPLTDADAGQRNAQTVLAQVVDAFDGSPTLGRSDVEDAVLVSGEQVFVTDQAANQQRVRLECRLMVRALST
jgi:hypothetical protein